MACQSRLRVVIADDHKLIADACKSILEPEYQVVGVATDGRALLESALPLQPDLILSDVSMPHLNGLEAARQLKLKLPSVKIVFLTMFADPEAAATAFGFGASGFVLKVSAAETLLMAMRKVAGGGSYIDPRISEQTLALIRKPAGATDKKATLTQRQRQILQLLGQGISMKQIADALNISSATVAAHKRQMMRTLGANSNAELLAYSIRELIPWE